MGKVVVQPFASEHRDGVLALYTKTFGAQAKAAFEAREKFSRTQNLAPAETGAWVLRREDDAQVLGFIAALPLPYRVRGQRFFAATTADFMVDPAAGFHGVTLMREAFKRFPRQVSIDDMAATKALLGLMKAKPIGELARWAKPLDLRLLKGRRAWASRVPDLVLASARPLLRVADRARRPSGLREVTEVRFDARFDRFAEAHCGRSGASVYRDLAYYQWRYGAHSPQRDVRVLALLDSRGELEAYTVVATSASSAWVLELCAPEGADSLNFMSLLVGAVRAARTSGAQVLYAPVRVGASAVETALSALGFMQREHRSVVYARPSPTDDETLRAGLLEGPWNVQFGDAEQSHGAVI
jgi:hypothetical protein